MSSTPIAQDEASRAATPRLTQRLLLGLTTCFALVALTAGGNAIDSAASSYDPSSDGYSMANLTSQLGASAWWNAGYTGAGVDVAVIDTGVSAVPALAGAGKVVYGPDLSLDSGSPSLRNLDSYGHGTFMAGLIAGHDSSLSAPYSRAPASAYRGVAPDARIVSVKVGATDGGVDVTQVIAAIDWVVRHAHDPGYDIRVINLSYGAHPGQSYTVDPLAHAAEQAWRHGIVVVAAAGNTGYRRGLGAPGLADPAYDPYVIGVGGYDTGGTATVDDDSIGSYSASSSGGHAKSPDFVAPGSHLQGLRVLGSYIDDGNPQGTLDPSYLRGSGTSEAAAITSGAIALILEKYPTLTPDEVKRFIEHDAQKLPGVSGEAQGSGELDLTAMLRDVPQGFPRPSPRTPSLPTASKQGYQAPTARPFASGPPVVLQPAAAPVYTLHGPPAPAARYPDSSGKGSFEGSRGFRVVTQNGQLGTGGIATLRRTAYLDAIVQAEGRGDGVPGGAFDRNALSLSGWAGNSWSGNSWSGNSWSGSAWASDGWN